MIWVNDGSLGDFLTEDGCEKEEGARSVFVLMLLAVVLSGPVRASGILTVTR